MSELRIRRGDEVKCGASGQLGTAQALYLMQGKIRVLWYSGEEETVYSGALERTGK